MFFNLKKFSFKKERIYFDSASALKTGSKFFANPSSIHQEGEKSKEALFEARKKIAKCIHAKSANIHFASSTTEANNIFIKGTILESLKSGNPAHIIYSTSDHSAIVDVVESLKVLNKIAGKNLVETTSVAPNKIGILPIEEIVKSITNNTRLICFSHVSSELGAVQEVRKIAQAVHDHYLKNNFPKESWPKIFIDASQAVMYENLDVGNLQVDGMSFGGSKIGSVSGVSVLYVKNGTKLEPIISGGGQEEGIRSGTENLPAIISLSEVLEKVTNPILQKKRREKVFALRNYCIEQLEKNFKTGLPRPAATPSLEGEELLIFGDTKFKFNKFFEHAAPHILLISLVDMLGEETLLRLDAKGISVTTASACSLLENSGSNFLKSLGEPILAKETIRLSFTEKNTKEEIDEFVKVLKEIQTKFLPMLR